MKKSAKDEKKTDNVAKALAEVPVDNKPERDALRARLRQKYTELEPLELREVVKMPVNNLSLVFVKVGPAVQPNISPAVWQLGP